MSISVRLRKAIRYQKENGEVPFDKWFLRLKDIAGKAKVITQIERAEKGLFGHVKTVFGEVKELKIDFGPGYRVYFAIHKDEIILLLMGGNKRTQQKDIKKAIEYWNDFKNREVQK